MPLTLNELLDLAKEEPEAAVKRGFEAYESANALAVKEADEKAAVLRNKDEILGQLKKRKDLGGEEEILKWHAAHDELEAQRAAAKDDGTKSKDDTPETLKLERRQWEAERDLIKRRHQEEVEKTAAEAGKHEAAARELQATLDRREIEAAIRTVGKGKVLEDAIGYLADRLEPVFRRETDGTWTLHNPRTDLAMKSSAGSGPKTVDELVEEAMESKGTEPWSQGLGFCFKPMEAGEGAAGVGQARIPHDHGKMTRAEKLAYIGKYGAEKFGAAVSKSTNQLALEASKAAAERRALRGLSN